MFEYTLTEANRLVLSNAFRNVPRVDIGIDSVIEGHMGKAIVDDPNNPGAFKLQVGPFCYFAGDFSSDPATEIIKQQEAYSLIMVCPEDAIEIARNHFAERLIRFPRYSFSSERLSLEYIASLIDDSSFRSRITKIDGTVLDRVASRPDHFLDISVFESATDFLIRGTGYAVIHNDAIAGVAYSSLICNSAIEVSIYVEPEYREQGMATALGCALIKECLKRSIDPHWDAANIESCRLAEKLGYVSAGTYDAYFVNR